MNIVIVTGPSNYTLARIYEPKESDYIIGADQGAYILANEAIHFDIAVGDFDSVSEQEYTALKEYATDIKTHSSKKNATDTYLALEIALKMEYDSITIYGGIGERFDHSIANMKLLKLGPIELITPHVRMYVIDAGTHDIVNHHDYISFFAMEDVKHLTLEGFDYELTGYDLEIDDPLCISNHGSGQISFQEGTVLVIHQNDV